MSRHLNSKNLILLLFFFSFAVLAAFILLDWENILQALVEVKPIYILFALLFTVVSYIFAGMSFMLGANLFGIKINDRELMKMGFITVNMNSLTAMGGVTTYAAKLSLLKKHSVRNSLALIFTFFHTNLINSILVMLLPLGLLYFFSTQGNVSIGGEYVVLELAIFVLIFLFFNVSIFVKKFRIIFFRMMKFFMKSVLRKEEYDFKFSRLDVVVDEVSGNIKNNKSAFIGVAAATILYWLFSIVVFGFCFYALGIHISPGALLAGYVFGVAIGGISIIPGGIGLQEASMAGVFSLLGFDFGTSVLASIVFRLIFSVLPFFYSFHLYRKG